jgi:hypothetical protein
MALSRREVLSGFALGAVGAAMGSPQASDSVPMASTDSMIGAIRDLRDHAHMELVSRLHTGRLVRPDGYLYTVDAAQLMICLAQLGDRDNYASLHDHCVTNLIRDRRDDPYTRGFVPWRYKQGKTPDASGTTEALRVVKGLWLGSRAFECPADAELARMVLQGYSTHGTIDQGVWMIRNYFVFQTRAFASNSFLVDYDPDLIREVADVTHDPALATLADNCLKVVQLSLAPCGLFYDLIQPELMTLYPELPMIAFSPNDVVGIANTGTTALGVTRQDPELVRKVLRFAMLNDGNLRRYYLGRSGRPAHDSPAAVCEYAVLVRLAVAINDADAVNRLLNRTLQQWHWIADRPEQCDAFLYGETLAATIAVLDWFTNTRGPATVDTVRGTPGV